MKAKAQATEGEEEHMDDSDYSGYRERLLERDRLESERKLFDMQKQIK